MQLEKCLEKKVKRWQCLFVTAWSQRTSLCPSDLFIHQWLLCASINSGWIHTVWLNKELLVFSAVLTSGQTALWLFCSQQEKSFNMLKVGLFVCVQKPSVFHSSDSLYHSLCVCLSVRLPHLHSEHVQSSPASSTNPRVSPKHTLADVSVKHCWP